MKVLSWNICSANKKQFEKLNLLIEKHNPDILCLQEVNLECCNKISEFKNYNSIQAIDYYCFKKRFKKKGNTEFKLVLMSKEKILNSKNENKFSVSELTKISLWERINKWQESCEFQFGDIKINNKIVRIFNVHLEVGAGPSIRFKQFSKITEYFSSENDNIVCGDFNIYGKWYKNFIIGWAMGFSFKEMFIDERRRFQKIFKIWKLQNPFYKKITYPAFALQLDHILVPHSWDIKNITVIKNRFGSDHRPIIIEI